MKTKKTIVMTRKGRLVEMETVTRAEAIAALRDHIEKLHFGPGKLDKKNTARLVAFVKKYLKQDVAIISGREHR